jgi:hypothetical protein
MPAAPIISDPFSGGSECLFVCESACDPSLKRSLLERPWSHSGATFAVASRESRQPRHLWKQGFWRRLRRSQAGRKAIPVLLGTLAARLPMGFATRGLDRALTSPGQKTFATPARAPGRGLPGLGDGTGAAREHLRTCGKPKSAAAPALRRGGRC